MIKNTGLQTITFQAISTTNGLAVTSGTPTVYVTIDGGTQTAGSGSVAHEGNGCWSYVPTKAETNGDHISFTFVLSGSINQTLNVYTSLSNVVLRTTISSFSRLGDYDTITLASGSSEDGIYDDCFAIIYDSSIEENQQGKIVASYNGSLRSFNCERLEFLPPIGSRVVIYGVKSLTKRTTAGENCGAAFAENGVVDANVVSANVTALTILRSLSGDSITMTRGDQWTFRITDLPDMTGYQKVWWTLKSSEDIDEDDDKSAIHIEITDGLLYANKATPDASSNGSITFISTPADGTAEIAVKGLETKKVVQSPLMYWNLSWRDSAGEVHTPKAGKFNLDKTTDVTRSV